ncbi:MAG: RNA polymerase sigma factor RpoD/SigA [Bacteroidetes bacterium]|nr:RNA polymerase sigma factor RpoD/SigA [Bacteroidota bacterium]
MRQLVINKSITNRDTASFEKYLQDIGKIELITADEEIILAQKIKKGDEQAFEKLVNANLRFVVSVAKQYQNRGLGLQDIVNEGNLGLIKAAKLFDETRGFKFISYAVWWIRQSILIAIAQQSRIVRLPINKIGDLRQINKVQTKFEQKNDRVPTPEELSKALNVSEKKLEKIIKSAKWVISIDAPSKEDETKSLINFMEDEQASNPEKPLMNESLKDEITRVVNTLPQKEQIIITYYYGLNGKSKTLLEIGDILNITRERARQLRDKAIRNLSKPPKKKLLREFLGQ